MRIARSVLEQNKRHEDRERLAKEVRAASVSRTISFRHAQEEGQSRDLPPKNQQVHQLSAGALHAAKDALQSAGVTGVRISHANVKIIEADKGPRMLLIRKAMIQVRASIPSADNVTYTKKDFKFAVKVGYENGRYAVHGLLKDGYRYPLSRENILKIATATEDDEE